MPTQFDAVMNELRAIHHKLDLIAERLDMEEDWLSQELPSEGDDPFDEVISPSEGLQVGRTWVEYRNLDGDIDRIDWEELDDRIIEAIRLARQYKEPWELYEGEDGKVRIMTSNEIVARIHKRHTPQEGR